MLLAHDHIEPRLPEKLLRPRKGSVVGNFDGEAISSDGSLLFSEVEAKTHIVDQLAGLFIDYRKPGLIEQRIFGSAQCGTIRPRLLEVAAFVRASARKVWISSSESFPLVPLSLKPCATVRDAG